MLIEAFLGRLVVVRHHQQAGIHTDLGRFAGQVNCLTGRVAARSGNDGNAPVSLFNHAADHVDMFIRIQRGGFTRRTDRDNRAGTRVDVILHQFIQAFPINTPFGVHRGNKCNQTPSDHIRSEPVKSNGNPGT